MRIAFRIIMLIFGSIALYLGVDGYSNATTIFQQIVGAQFLIASMICLGFASLD